MPRSTGSPSHGRTRLSRLAPLFGVAALVLAACAGPADDAGALLDDETLEPEPPEGQEEATVPDDPPPFPWERVAAGEDVPGAEMLAEIISGGPPPDGIPPIDAPVYESVEAASEWLGERDPVMLAEAEGIVRAYPLAILTFHEIVNTWYGDTPVVVTYCPLCNSGLNFERQLDGEVLSFGTSGRLWLSNLVMYDRGSRSLWSQFTGEVLVGDRLGDRLERLPMQIVSFGDVVARWPDIEVLSRETGHNRPYGENPYVGYDTSERPFLFDGPTDDTLAQMTRVVAAGNDVDDPVAYTWDLLQSERVVHDAIAGEPAVVFWAPGTASALDTRDISEGEDVGATGVFSTVVDGEELTFVPDGEDRFVDEQSGSTWTVLGEAVDGPLEGTQLERLIHDDTFWFVQFAFQPETRVVGEA